MLDLASLLIGAGLTVVVGAFSTLLNDQLQRQRDAEAYGRTFHTARVERLRRLYTVVIGDAETLRTEITMLSLRRLDADYLKTVMDTTTVQNKLLAELNLEPGTSAVIAKYQEVRQAFTTYLKDRVNAAQRVDADASSNTLQAAFAGLLYAAHMHLAALETVPERPAWRLPLQRSERGLQSSSTQETTK